MEDNPTLAPAGWLDVLTESDVDVAAGQIVPGTVIHRGLRDSIARIQARRATHRGQFHARIERPDLKDRE